MFCLRQMCSQRSSVLLTIGIYTMFFAVRLFCLDQDLPPWGIATYQPIDEGAYAQLALHYVNYGDMNPNNGASAYPIYCAEQLINNLIGNLFVLSGLSLLGDNYYGLRIPYVLISFLVFFSVHIVLLKLRNLYGKKNSVETLLLLAILAYLSIDFAFSMAGRVVEPSILRGLFLQFMIMLYLFVMNDKIKWFFMGFVATISVFLVYISNMFLFLILGFMLCFLGIKYGFRKSFVDALWMFLGIISALAISEYYYHQMWNVGAVANAWSSVVGFQRLGTYDTRSLYDIAKHAVSFVSAHANFYNIAPVFIFICVLGDIAAYCVRKLDENIAFFLFIFLAFGLQTLASDDYIVRKYILIYPAMWYLLYFRFLVRSEFTAGSAYIQWKQRNMVRIYCAAALVCWGIVSFRLFMIHDGTPLDFSLLDKIILLSVPIAVSIYSFLEMGIRLGRYFRPGWIVLAYLLSVGINSYFIGKYIFANPTFSEKEIMENLREFNGRYVLGEYENGFSLYNSIKPVLNTSQMYQSFLAGNPELYYFDYGDDWDGNFRYYLDHEIFTDCPYTVVPFRYFERKFQVAGNKRVVALYKAIPKEDVRKHYRNLRNKYLAIRKDLETEFLNEAIFDGEINKEMYGKDYIEDSDFLFWEKLILHNGCYAYVDYFDLSLVQKEYRKQSVKKLEQLLEKKRAIREKFLF